MKNIRLVLSLAILLGFTSLVVWSATSSASTPIVTFARDLDGSLTGQTVVGIGGKPLPPLTAGALSYDGGSWYFGTAGGGVSPGAAGQALFTNDAGAATVWAYPHGDVDASASDPGALTVNAIQGFGVSTSTPSTGNTLSYSSGLWRPAALNLAGGSNYVTGVLPNGNQASQSLGGDLGGTTASGTVRLAATSSHIDLGGTVAGSGSIRGANATTLLTARDATNAVDISLIQTDNSNDIIIGDVPHLGSNIVLNNNTAFSALGGWGITWFSGGELAGVSGNILMGTHGNNAWTTTLEAGNSIGIATLSATSGAGSELSVWKGVINLTTTTAPGSPGSGMNLYVDTSDGKFKAKDAAGNIFVLAP